MQTVDYSALNDKDKELADSAAGSLSNSYNPYTGHLFGAAVKTSDEKIVLGSNLFSSATGVNVCAERAAIISSFSQGSRDIIKLAVISNSKKDEILTPCGICRQFLYGITEITGHDIELICINPAKTKALITTVAELYPSPYISE